MLTKVEDEKLTKCFMKAIESAVQEHLEKGGKISDLDWFNYEPWDIDDRKEILKD